MQAAAADGGGGRWATLQQRKTSSSSSPPPRTLLLLAALLGGSGSGGGGGAGLLFGKSSFQNVCSGSGVRVAEAFSAGRQLPQREQLRSRTAVQRTRWDKCSGKAV
jgi:hypothetical protein